MFAKQMSENSVSKRKGFKRSLGTNHKQIEGMFLI